jgi:hypothetical protein
MFAHVRKRTFSSLLNWEKSVFSLGPLPDRTVRVRAVPLPTRPFAIKGSNAERTLAALALGISPVYIIGQFDDHRFCHGSILTEHNGVGEFQNEKPAKR